MQTYRDPHDAAVLQAIEDSDAAVRRVFQQRVQATLNRHSQQEPHQDERPLPEAACSST